MNRTRRLLYGVALLAPLLLAAGCLIPYATPKMSYLPEVDPSSKSADCRVFRFDSVVHEMKMGVYPEYTLTELIPGTDGKIPSQTSVLLDHKNLVIGPAYISENYDVCVISRTRLRLYRPGYRLVELGSLDSGARIQWQPATWSDQEQAIDALLSGPPAVVQSTSESFTSNPKPKPPFEQLPKVTRGSAEETRPLLFAAVEYERVAKIAPTPADATRLREKAEWLRATVAPRKSDTQPAAASP